MKINKLKHTPWKPGTLAISTRKDENKEWVEAYKDTSCLRPLVSKTG